MSGTSRRGALSAFESSTSVALRQSVRVNRTVSVREAPAGTCSAIPGSIVKASDAAPRISTAVSSSGEVSSFVTVSRCGSPSGRRASKVSVSGETSIVARA